MTLGDCSCRPCVGRRLRLCLCGDNRIEENKKGQVELVFAVVLMSVLFPFLFARRALYRFPDGVYSDPYPCSRLRATLQLNRRPDCVLADPTLWRLRIAHNLLEGTAHVLFSVTPCDANMF